MEATANTAAGHLLLVDLTPPDAPNPQQLAISVSPERARYNAIRLEYVQRAARAEAAFSAAYDEDILSLDMLIEQVNELAADILAKELSQTVSDLVAMGAYSLSEATFLQEYGDEEMGWGQAYLRIADRYAEIVMSAEQLDAYRVSRREARGKVMAIGDSVGGLAKGYVMAAGVNLAIGTVHAAFNGVGKILSAIGDSMKKSRIFNDPETKDSLCADLRRAVFLLHYAFIDAANGVLGASIEGMEEDEEVKEALGLFDNIRKGRLPAERVPELLGHALTLAPYTQDIYDLILLQYGDPTGSLEKAAAYFGIDLGATKARLIEKEGEALLESQESWEARAQKLKALQGIAGANGHSLLAHYQDALASGALEAWLGDVKLTHQERAAKLAGLCDGLGIAEGDARRGTLLAQAAEVEEAALLEQAFRISKEEGLSPERRREQLAAIAMGMGLKDMPVYGRAKARLKIREEAAALCASDEPLGERMRKLVQLAEQQGLAKDDDALRAAVFMLESADISSRTVEGKVFETKEAAQSQAKVNHYLKIAVGIGIALFGLAVIKEAVSPAAAPPQPQVSEAVAAPSPVPEAEALALEALAPLAAPTDPAAVPVMVEGGRILDGASRLGLDNARLESADGQQFFVADIFSRMEEGVIGKVVMRVAFYDANSARLGVETWEKEMALGTSGIADFAQPVPYAGATRFEVVELRSELAQ